MVLTSIAIALFCFIVSLLAIIAVNAFKKERYGSETMIVELARQTKIAFAAWFFCFLAYLAALCLLPNKIIGESAAINFAYGMVIYFVLSFIYLAVYNFASRSISATLLEIIENSPGGRLTADEVKRTYNIENKYQTELGWMIDSGLIRKNLYYYNNTPMGSLGAKTAILVKKILKLGPGG